MAHQDRSDDQADEAAMPPIPVAQPYQDTTKPEGLAFDVDKDADMSGVPVGDQTAHHQGASHTEDVVREAGSGVGLAVPEKSG
jgi:hypothetical protein